MADNIFDSRSNKPITEATPVGSRIVPSHVPSHTRTAAKARRHAYGRPQSDTLLALALGGSMMDAPAWRL